ncbi:hypothetical protein AB0O28_28350 [Microbispora sp. NPDC088329]|uniref:hypothetical protein n=1 Tax=Microbispora sp. NPDC088329 TaxID=3154869 RepID=UPI00342B723D
MRKNGKAARGALLSVGVAAGLLVGSGTMAAVSAAVDGGEIMACAGADNVLRLAPSPSPSATCAEGEKPVSWNAVGPQGPAGPPGPGAGETYQSVPRSALRIDVSGNTRPAPATAAVLNLPAGAYVFNVDLSVSQLPSEEQESLFDAECALELASGLTLPHPVFVEVTAGRREPMSFTRAFTLKSPTTVSLKCSAQRRGGDSDFTVILDRHYLTATRVSSVTQTVSPAN